jgi:hypothetical protein
MKHLNFFSAVVLSGSLLAGCAGTAHVEKDDAVDFTNYHTYAWVDSRDHRDDSAKVKVSDLTERRIREAVNTELAKSGWKESKHKADVLLSYDVLMERTVKENNNPVYSDPAIRYVFNPYRRRWVSVYYPSQFLGYDRDQRSVREGTITVSFIDAKTDKTVWQGWATGEVNSRNLTTREIQSSVKSIFKKFDVAKN